MQKLDGGYGPGRGVVHAVDCEEAPAGAPLPTLDQTLDAAKHPGTRLCSLLQPMLDVPYELVEHVSWLIHARSRVTTAPAPPSAPLTTATVNFRSTTSSTTATTPVSALQANTPSPAPSPGDSTVAGWGGSSVHGYVILSRPRRYTPIVETAGRARPLRRRRVSPRSTAPTTRCWPC
ncbi:DUF6233 domain-containing protein [Streptomyces sp. NPDC001843]|uniref:DUF6233 domain-containing protein n=1 Tax=Streptomyces sp. NPDC001843 TaxID=3364617 RepID=UPI0036C269CA